MQRFLCTFLITFLSLAGFAQPYEFGKSYLDKEGWTGMIVGNMPLVISVPHGGAMQLEEVEDRSCADAVTVTDSYTKELALEIQEDMFKRYGLKPYVVICNLTRKEVDQNREIEAGTCGNELMTKPWKVFHDFIDTALAMATKQFGSCMYIDLHGHGHPEQRLEVGYLLKNTELPDAAVGKGDVEGMSKKSSMNNLIQLSGGKISLQDMMVGEKSFGTLMANEGFPSVPSKQDPSPAEGEKYFNGGYNTKRYTSSKYPNVFGLQIESNYKGVRDAAGRPVFARAFGKVIIRFIQLNTSITLPELKTQP